MSQTDISNVRDNLLELGTVWRGGAEVRRYASAGERLVAQVSPGAVRLKRSLGVMGAGLSLTLDELAIVARLLPHWRRRRTAWASFEESGAGYAPGWGGRGTWYQPPGRKPRIKIGERLMGKWRGEQLVGREERRPVSARPIARVGVAQVGKIVRVGERHGDPAGEIVGVVFRLGNLEMEARRDGLMLRRGNASVAIEPREEAFFATLLPLVQLITVGPKHTRGDAFG